MDQPIKILILGDCTSDVDLIFYELKKNDLVFFSKVTKTRYKYEKALETFKPDIIFADFSLRSFDAVSAFKVKQQKLSEVPFLIIVSDTIGEENAVELIKKGVTDYVLKDKLFSLPPKMIRALKESNELKEKRKSEERLKTQVNKLKEIASLQSHQVRGPLASILGLINLFNFEDPCDPLNLEIMKRLQQTSINFDTIIHEIVQKTNEIKNY